MLIKPEDINKVLELSGNAVSTRGKKYFEKSKVKVAKLDMEDDENYTSKSYVEGTYIYDVNVSKKIIIYHIVAIVLHMHLLNLVSILLLQYLICM